MANTPTTNFALNKPAAGDFDWDDELNGDLDSIDSLLYARPAGTGTLDKLVVWTGTRAVGETSFTKNDVTIQGNTFNGANQLVKLSAGAKIPLTATQTHVHDQAVASALWTITHNMGKRPSVTVVDSGLNTVIGDVVYVDDNSLTIGFAAAFAGKAYLN